MIYFVDLIGIFYAVDSNVPSWTPADKLMTIRPFAICEACRVYGISLVLKDVCFFIL